jgi:hypothetical protein
MRATSVSPDSTRTDMLSTAGLCGLEPAEDFAHTQLIRRLVESDESLCGSRSLCQPS